MRSPTLSHLKRRADEVIRESREAMRQLAVLRVKHLYVAQLVEQGAERPWNGGHNGPSTPSQWQPLSPREREVLGLLVDGKSTKEIAAELGIAFRTAACHRSAIMQKLNVHDTASMVREAIRWGLVRL